ncbi:type II toxin-antitoxin system VapC family toxin [Geobacter sp.]|uniref:type II toxin-antitoxin system VapC family toxin n=1 Tax=Geobacter sp. TaxID=46610 RepID=UPI002634A8DC|nr:type II toxin-antitoxin system VapC family toxin [Geobacter sp.]
MIVLDTHAWVWWVSSSEMLGAAARRAVDEAARAHELFVSTISAWEVAMLVEKGRLSLTLDVRDWIARSEALPFLTFVPLSNAIAVESVRLPGFPHADPADRIIVATALSLGAILVTKDEKISAYPHVKCLW